MDDQKYAQTAFPGHLGDGFEKIQLVAHIQIAGGLIQNEVGCFLRQGAGQHDLLRLPSAEARHVAHGQMLQAQLGELFRRQLQVVL